MAANLTVHTPMLPIGTISGNTPETRGIPEKAAQTFLSGVPVQLNAGFVQKWDGTTYTAGLLGISNYAASNLPSNGYGAPTGFGPITGIGALNTYGNVPNQPNAVNIPYGSPAVDGRTLVVMAGSDSIFEGQCDNSVGAVAADYTPTQAMVGTYRGLTFDTGGTCYVDLGKSTSGTNTCVQITRLSPEDMTPAGVSIVNGRVQFIFQKGAIQNEG
jgi:hypothetical protein